VEQGGSGDCGNAERTLHQTFGKRFSTSEVVFYILLLVLIFGIMIFLRPVVGDDEFLRRVHLRRLSLDGWKKDAERWVYKLSPILRRSLHEIRLGKT
jgi:hypothetical protein